MLPLPLITVFDLETTGLDPKRGHRIIEIAGVRIEGGKIQSESPFISLVNPEREIPSEAKQVHKISDEEVAKAPTIDAVLPKFLDFAKGSLLFAHNAQFDMGFLAVEKHYCWGYVDIPECCCTMRLSQALFPREFRHSLDILSKRLGLSLPAERHRALADAILAAEALLKMAETGHISSCDELRRKAGMPQLATV